MATKEQLQVQLAQWENVNPIIAKKIRKELSSLENSTGVVAVDNKPQPKIVAATTTATKKKTK
jgi:hypothetical protein